MSNTYEFYRERYNDIQRHVYYFLNEMPLTETEQRQILKEFSLGTNFETIESVQEYNDDRLIKGFVKVDIREADIRDGRIKGKMIEPGMFLQEAVVQIPTKFFERKEEELKEEVYHYCMEMVAARIREHINSLDMQKKQIEAEMKKYTLLLEKYTK